MIANHLAVVIKRDDHVNTHGEMFLEKEISSKPGETSCLSDPALATKMVAEDHIGSTKSVIGSQDSSIDAASPVSTCLTDADIVVNHGSGVKSSIPKDDKEIKSEEFSRPNADLGNNDVIILDNTDVVDIASEKKNIPVDLSKMSNADTESLEIVDLKETLVQTEVLDAALDILHTVALGYTYEELCSDVGSYQKER